ncbi:MAG: DNA ligase D [Deltaproteobacteria bacterium]|nr:DNA ligase D [Deltaproteobacteria bacterium]
MGEEWEIEEYRKKRDFNKTPEPSSDGIVQGGGIFAVQKHSARALHYDLRLEMKGTLKSWAIPKGPSLNPSEKRLSVRVEDHPIEYGGFEGIIPKGEYGGGTVLLWDRGFWVPEGDPLEGLRKGALKFTLCGRKLRGKWTLVKLKKQRDADDERDEWILVKENDGEARPEGEIVEKLPKSVLSGRAIEEIAVSPAGIWTDAKEASLTALYMPEINAVKAPLPKKLLPQLATLVATPPDKDNWLYEIKYDGYRILSRLENGGITLYTRGGNDWTDKFRKIAETLSSLPISNAWLDGEIVSLREDGTTSFGDLQYALSIGKDDGLTYLVFDILFYNGYDLKETPLSDRKTFLKAIIEGYAKGAPNIRYSEHFEGSGEVFFSNACRYNIEGIVAKRKDSPYRQGRTRLWLKLKCHLRQEFVIGGYSAPGGARAGFGALLVGVYGTEGKLIYCGRVGTGFSEASLNELSIKMKGLPQEGPPFANPPAGAEAKDVIWVRPELVAEVEFSEWTKDGILRHASYQGLRADKPAGEVRKEAAAEGEPQPGIKTRFRLTHPDKVLYPEEGYTKKDLAEYYEMIAPLMLPHLANRPLTLLRCPEGYDKGCFYQKHSDTSIPEGIERVPIQEEDKMEDYMTVDNTAGLIGLVQLGVLEIHTWGSRAPKIEFPDKITFDMDPDTALPWERVVEAAYLVRELLLALGLVSFLKTTGGKGLHIVLPFEPLRDWGEIKAFTRATAEFIASGLPRRFTSSMTKARRAEKVFIDYMRNMRGATAIEAYSARARRGAPVSAPISWDELINIRPDSFNIGNMKDRLKTFKKDPWEGYKDIRQFITAGMKDKLGMKER